MWSSRYYHIRDRRPPPFDLPVKNLLAFSKSAFEKIYHGFNTEMHHNIIQIHNNVLWDIHEWSIRYYYIRDRWPPPFDPNLLQSFRLRFAPSFFLHLHVKDLLAFSTFALEKISHDLTRKCVITFKSIQSYVGQTWFHEYSPHSVWMWERSLNVLWNIGSSVEQSYGSKYKLWYESLVCATTTCRTKHVPSGWEENKKLMLVTLILHTMRSVWSKTFNMYSIYGVYNENY